MRKKLLFLVIFFIFLFLKTPDAYAACTSGQQACGGVGIASSYPHYTGYGTTQYCNTSTELFAGNPSCPAGYYCALTGAYKASCIQGCTQRAYTCSASCPSANIKPVGTNGYYCSSGGVCCSATTTTKYACVNGACQQSSTGTYTDSTCSNACTSAPPPPPPPGSGCKKLNEPCIETANCCKGYNLICAGARSDLRCKTRGIIQCPTCKDPYKLRSDGKCYTGGFGRSGGADGQTATPKDCPDLGGKVLSCIATGLGGCIGDEPTSTNKVPPSPCTGGLNSKGGCANVKTGLGITIGAEAGSIVKSILGVILSISGGIALLLIIISGYKLMASQGNPEKIQGAREQLTAAIVGLLFIIFSLVILQTIGVDILRIPGFK